MHPEETNPRQPIETPPPLKPHERKLSHEALSIEVPTLDTLPHAPVDAVLILGMGPVMPTLATIGLERKVVMGIERMKHNALAAKELAVRGFVAEDGLIIASGRTTANSEAVTADYKKRQLDAERTLSIWPSPLPVSEEEVARVIATSEGKLMKELMDRARPKNLNPNNTPATTPGETAPQPDTTQRKQENTQSQETGKKGINVFLEDQAGNTFGNYIHAFNELDKRSRATTGTLFKGSIAVVTAEFGHVARAAEVAKLFGVADQIVPLTSQQLLRDFGYTGRLYTPEGEIFNKENAWYEQMLVRTMRELPEFVLPEMHTITDPERLIQVLSTMEGIYGPEVFAQHNLSGYKEEDADTVREKLKSIVRLHPQKEAWMKKDTDAITEAIQGYKNLTTEWLQREQPTVPTPPTTQ